MAKTRRTYVCAQCGGVSPKWMGRCPDCGAWDALEEMRLGTSAIEAGAGRDPQMGLAERWVGLAGAPDDDRAGGVSEIAAAGEGEWSASPADAPKAVPLSAVRGLNIARLEAGIGEFDRVLGGGLVQGSTILVGGEPGIGKSTLLLQAALKLAQHVRPAVRVLYVSSEESAQQIQARADRLRQGDESGRQAEGEASKDDLFILADTNLARIFEQARRVRPSVMVIDSIQMIYNASADASPGSLTQLRRCCMDLVYLAKISGMTILLVGHVTKDGQLAGPRMLEHLVDVVLYFEGDRYHAHRVIRAVKNRYGTTLEIGLFEMGGTGLIEITDPSGAALYEPGGPSARSGSVITSTLQGSRCFLVEIQALTANGILGAAKRKVSGLDGNRFAMLLAVLEKHAGMRLADQDVFASVVGGMRVQEPASDLALALAIGGAHLQRSIDPRTIVLGEIGLGGEVRRVNQLDQRLREAMRLGFTQAIIPAGAESGALMKVRGIEPMTVTNIGQAVEYLR